VKVLFDHCVPRPLRRHLPGHEIVTARAMGWDALDNGKLLAAAEPHFEVMITSDKNIAYQQNRAGRRIAIIVLPTKSRPLLLPLAPKILKALASIQPGGWMEIDF
jgi:predicted nuclease of predicted toxin-antitoxin system